MLIGQYNTTLQRWCFRSADLWICCCYRAVIMTTGIRLFACFVVCFTCVSIELLAKTGWLYRWHCMEFLGCMYLDTTTITALYAVDEGGALWPLTSRGMDHVVVVVCFTA